jgi:hypothetical protein
MSKWRSGLQPTPQMPMRKRAIRAVISGLVLLAVVARMTGSVVVACAVGVCFAALVFWLDSMKPRDKG